MYISNSKTNYNVPTYFYNLPYQKIYLSSKIQTIINSK